MKPDEAPRLKGYSTATQIARELGISRQTVNLMIRNGEFKTLTLYGEEEKPGYMVKTSELQKIKQTRTFPRRKS